MLTADQVDAIADRAELWAHAACVLRATARLRALRGVRASVPADWRERYGAEPSPTRAGDD